MRKCVSFLLTLCMVFMMTAAPSARADQEVGSDAALAERIISLLNNQPDSITIALQAPKLAPHIGAMRSRLAEVMGISPDRVSVKATTTERLGFVGRREGCEVWAIVLIERK